MIISDLNYLEAIEGSELVGSGGVYFNSYFGKKVYVKEYIDNRLYNDIKSKVDVKGNAAEAEGVADAYGDDTKTLALGGTQTTPYSSESFVKTISATDDKGYYPY